VGYLTPDTAPDTVQCRALFVPDSPEFLAVIRGAIEELTLAKNWTRFGLLSPDDAALACVDMFDRFCLEKASCRMIGEVVAYAGVSSPNPNWLNCDGSEVLKADYPNLFAVIGDTYGSAGVGYFKLPDLRGRSLSGAGTGVGLSPVSVGASYGEESHTLVVTEIPAHSHSDIGHQHTTGNSFTFLALTGEEPVLMPNPIPAQTGVASANIQNTGGGGEHNTVGPRLGVMFLIVAKDG